jgi:GNAT superfamily N-acetyltransferase
VGTFKIVKANSPEHLLWIKKLFREYADFLSEDLSFQNFEQELNELPGHYALPSGILLLALQDTHPAGCVALRKITPEICEMKRLFVRSEYRNFGVGKALAMAIIKEAVQLGYHKMRLDTLISLQEAIGLYRRLGFYPIEPYCFNPLPGAVFMEVDLS